MESWLRKHAVEEVEYAVYFCAPRKEVAEAAVEALNDEQVFRCWAADYVVGCDDDESYKKAEEIVRRIAERRGVEPRLLRHTIECARELSEEVLVEEMMWNVLGIDTTIETA